MPSPKPNPLTFQELTLRLQTFWAARGCVLQPPYDLEVGAGTMAPETFLRVLGPQPYKVAYVQPSRRPADGRYGENPNRLYKHCLLYTSDAADERSSVDLGGRRIIKKK